MNSDQPKIIFPQHHDRTRHQPRVTPLVDDLDNLLWVTGILDLCRAVQQFGFQVLPRDQDLFHSSSTPALISSPHQRTLLLVCIYIYYCHHHRDTVAPLRTKCRMGVSTCAAGIISMPKALGSRERRSPKDVSCNRQPKHNPLCEATLTAYFSSLYFAV